MIRYRMAQLLALLMVPVIVLSTPQTARALDAVTVAYGPTVTAKMHTEQSTFVGNDDVSCSNTGYLRLNSLGVYSIPNKLRCNFGNSFDYNDAVSLRAWGGDDGEDCSFSGYYQPEDDVDLDTVLVPVNLHTSEPLDPNCAITRGTIVFWNTSWSCDAGFEHFAWVDTNTEGLCALAAVDFDWELGALPTGNTGGYDGSCPFFSFTGKPYLTTTPSGTTSWQPGIVFPGLTWAAASAANSTSTSTALRWGAVVENKSTGARTVNYAANVGQGNMGSQPRSSWVSTGPGKAGNGSFIPFNVNSSTTAAAALASFTDTYRLVGVQMAVSTASDSLADSGYYLGPNQDAWSDAIAVDDALPAGDASKGEIGLTKPTLCRYYFGEKIASSSTSTLDEPASSLGTGPPGSAVTDPAITNPDPDVAPAETGCEGFSFTDPASWAGAGICVLVKAMRALVGVMQRLVQLVSGLVAAIGDLMYTLLVPSPSSWDMGGLRDQLDSRPPFSVVSDLGDTASGVAAGYTDASGCGTIADFDTSGQSYDNNAQLKCDQMKSTPGYGVLYQLARAALWCMAGLAIYRMCAARFEKG